ncbi:MAG TPA: hypothetical protein VFW40_11610 [Capsulimonadaceae bacterium]|nr:hypothetical protein [Capsulimonadaceae bacterium]
MTRRSRVEGKNADPFAADRLQDLMDAIKIRFPRLKMVCFFDRNNLTGATPGRSENDYSLPSGSLALESLRKEMTDPYFLGRIDESSPESYLPVPTTLPRSYRGPIASSLSTHSLDPTLDVARGRGAVHVSRPYEFTLGQGSGPITITVRDPHGRAAKTTTLFAP